MNAKELVKNRTYRYTGGHEPVEVIYMYETINGGMFLINGEKYNLNRTSIDLFVEEIPHTANLRSDKTK
jgi:hypothetical protein